MWIFKFDTVWIDWTILAKWQHGNMALDKYLMSKHFALCPMSTLAPCVNNKYKSNRNKNKKKTCKQIENQYLMSKHFALCPRSAKLPRPICQQWIVKKSLEILTNTRSLSSKRQVTDFKCILAFSGHNKCRMGIYYWEIVSLLQLKFVIKFDPQ